MHTMVERSKGWKRRVLALVAASLALLTVGVGVVPQLAAADGQNLGQVAGTFSFAGRLLVGCQKGALICSAGTYTGDLAGPFTLTLLTNQPGIDPGTEAFTGLLTLRPAGGTLKCTLDGVSDATPKSEGEFGEICRITSGTGAYQGAKGHLRLMGTSHSTLGIPSGSGEYAGHVILP